MTRAMDGRKDAIVPKVKQQAKYAQFSLFKLRNFCRRPAEKEG